MKALLYLLCIGGLALAQQANTANGSDGSKSARAMYKATEKSYRLTKIKNRKNATTIEAQSRPINVKNFKVLGRRGLIEYYIVSELDQTTGESASKIVIETSGSEAVLEGGSAMPASQRQISGARKHQWNGYSVRYFKKAMLVEMAAQQLEGRTQKARSGSAEILEISINTTDLAKPIRFGSGISIVLHSKISPEMTLEIPFSFLVGYFAKVSGQGFLSEKEESIASQLREAIKNQVN